MRFRVLLECASHWGWVRFSDPSEILSKVNLKVCQWSVVPTKVRTRLETKGIDYNPHYLIFDAIRYKVMDDTIV